MSKALLFGLLLAILMVIAPHAAHLPYWVSGLCLGLLSWRAYLAHSDGPLPQRWLLIVITLGSVIGIEVTFRTMFGRDPGVTLLVLLAALKLMELRTTRDAMVLVFLACFIVITNFFYSQSIPTALYMVATLMAIVMAWVHLHAQNIALQPRIRLASVMLLQAFPLTLILFLLFPRVPGPLWGMPQDAFASTGLDDKMSPGSLTRLSLSDAVAFRVTFEGNPPPREEMYWRGPVLWEFDGRTWTLGKTAILAPPKLTDLGEPVNYVVTLEPNNKNWLFALEMPDKISIPSIVTYDLQLLRKEPVTARLRYSARSELKFRANVEETQKEIQRNLQIPRRFNPRAQKLAAEWRARNANDAAIVRTALSYFNREGFEYTLEPPPLGTDSIDDFLFETKQGFCEYYASAFVYLMRAANIPARIVTGYLGGEYNVYGNYYIVRQADAHAWAEVWLEGQGWVRADPTAAIAPERVRLNLAAAVRNDAALPFMVRNPPNWLRNLSLNWDSLANQWNQWVLGYNTERQFAFLTRMGMESITWQKIVLNMMAGVIVVVSLLALVMLRHLFMRHPDRVQAAWLRLCRKLAKAGLPRAPHEGALDYAKRVGTSRPELAGAIEDLAVRYNAIRYGGNQDDAARNQFLQRAAALKI